MSSFDDVGPPAARFQPGGGRSGLFAAELSAPRRHQQARRLVLLCDELIVLQHRKSLSGAAEQTEIPYEGLTEMAEPEQPEFVRHVETLRTGFFVLGLRPRRPQRYPLVARKDVATGDGAGEYLPDRERAGERAGERKARIPDGVVRERTHARQPSIPPARDAPDRGGRHVTDADAMCRPGTRRIRPSRTKPLGGRKHRSADRQLRD
ncbi:hypothetical protein [Bradyrhizobium elkanii]|uniref:hypothetical protein n=1 Tax=Bradyrhizobium elkanii TaxID=29448 RepID=UPI0036F42845